MSKDYRWYPVSEKPFPDKQGVYKCTLNDGEVYSIFCGCYANGWSWDINRNIKIRFDIKDKGKPEVVAWFPNPEPYKPDFKTIT